MHCSDKSRVLEEFTKSPTFPASKQKDFFFLFCYPQKMDESLLFAEVSRQLIQSGLIQAPDRKLVVELSRALKCKAFVENIEPGLSLALSIPPLLDMAWHVMILNTAMYAQFCRDELGLQNILPHTTTTDGDDQEAKDHRVALTCAIYQSLYGSGLDARIWQLPEQQLVLRCAHRCKDKTTCKHRCCKRQEIQPIRPFRIHIKNLEGKTLTAYVSRAMPVLVLKHLIAHPFDRLIFAATSLLDSQLISDTSLLPDSTVHLVSRLRGC
jgi:hypothetical protein